MKVDMGLNTYIISIKVVHMNGSYLGITGERSRLPGRVNE
jgi:hypothetical protein